MTALENQALRIGHIRVYYTIIVSTAVIVSSLAGFYFGIIAKIEKVSENNEKRWAVHDVEHKQITKDLDESKGNDKNHEFRITRIEIR